ncbi:MAG: DNA alkylation repair protein [Vicinamibacterales bacterium]
MTAAAAVRRLTALGTPEHARTAAWFFKTGRGQYGEGDKFLGVRVPAIRTLVREAASMPLEQVEKLLASPWHEARLLAVLVLVRQFETGTPADQRAIYRLYLKNIRHLNNWDIIDSSSPHIVGRYLDGRGRATLLRLARSSNLWSRRIAMLATFVTIRRNDHGDALAIATQLVNDREDLIHKAVGWMLREVGQRDPEALATFLNHHAATMPRTMLRYAIEKLPAAERRRYMRAAVTCWSASRV